MNGDVGVTTSDLATGSAPGSSTTAASSSSRQDGERQRHRGERAADVHHARSDQHAHRLTKSVGREPRHQIAGALLLEVALVQREEVRVEIAAPVALQHLADALTMNQRIAGKRSAPLHAVSPTMAAPSSAVFSLRLPALRPVESWPTTHGMARSKKLADPALRRSRSAARGARARR
ncbi:MAG: hypothetical protein U1E76_20135 [Planctomycetota bacterium]